MALVPYRVSGAAADQSANERLFQVGGITLRLFQEPHSSGGSLRPLSNTPRLNNYEDADDPGDNHQASHGRHAVPPAAGGIGSAVPPAADGATPHMLDGLANVGLVVWQSGFVLAEYLLRRPPWGACWRDVSVVDLGSGTGILGLALALAGATVALTDLPHVLPLTARNVAVNFKSAASCNIPAYLSGAADLAGAAQFNGALDFDSSARGACASPPSPIVVEHTWGNTASAAALRVRLAAQMRRVSPPAVAVEASSASAGDRGREDGRDKGQNAATSAELSASSAAATGAGGCDGGQDSLLSGDSRRDNGWDTATVAHPSGASAGGGGEGRDSVPDLITAADVLYEPALFGVLLDSLQALCAPHTVVYISYRSRSVEEEGFAALAAARGFALEEVPSVELHDEYCDGQYHILRLTPWNAMSDS